MGCRANNNIGNNNIYNEGSRGMFTIELLYFFERSKTDL
jgi:hypothetical protein